VYQQVVKKVVSLNSRRLIQIQNLRLNAALFAERGAKGLTAESLQMMRAVKQKKNYVIRTLCAPGQSNLTINHKDWQI